ncbi:MAG: HAMP domain-containing protein, partial [Chloroflexi bacterium]
MFNIKWIFPNAIEHRFMTWIAHMSINRRLLLASVIVAIIPGLVISLLGGVHLQVLNVYGQAVQVSTDSVTTATTQLANLQQMNANLISLQSGKFVASNVNGTQDAHINLLKQHLNEEIATLQMTCKQTLLRYQQSYQLATSDNMESVRRQLANDKMLATVQEQQRNTLALVIQQEWPAYIQAQNRELQALKSNLSSATTYDLLMVANEKFAPLEKDWNNIVALAETMSDNVAQIDATYKVDFTVFAIVASLIILFVVAFIGYIVHLTIARPLSDLVKLTRRISKGDTTARIEINGSDEIYLVAESMNSMMDNIVQLIQEVQ